MIKSKIVQADVQKIVKVIKKDAKVLSGKTILITGGSGFLGKYFLYTIWYLNNNFLSKPCKIISLDNLPMALELLCCAYNNITLLDNLPPTMKMLLFHITLLELHPKNFIIQYVYDFENSARGLNTYSLQYIQP